MRPRRQTARRTDEVAYRIGLQAEGADGGEVGGLSRSMLPRGHQAEMSGAQRYRSIEVDVSRRCNLDVRCRIQSSHAGHGANAQCLVVPEVEGLAGSVASGPGERKSHGIDAVLGARQAGVIRAANHKLVGRDPGGSVLQMCGWNSEWKIYHSEAHLAIAGIVSEPQGIGVGQREIMVVGHDTDGAPDLLDVQVG